MTAPVWRAPEPGRRASSGGAPPLYLALPAGIMGGRGTAASGRAPGAGKRVRSGGPANGLGKRGEMGRLTTHVLDTMAGGPAAGVTVELRTVGGGARRLKTVTTNADGRADAPLLEGAALAAGRYELRFRVGDYLRKRHGLDATPLFLDEIPVRFGIADPDQHYHVPLLLSAHGYSTYRGS